MSNKEMSSKGGQAKNQPYRKEETLVLTYWHENLKGVLSDESAADRIMEVFPEITAERSTMLRWIRAEKKRLRENL